MGYSSPMMHSDHHACVVGISLSPQPRALGLEFLGLRWSAGVGGFCQSGFFTIVASPTICPVVAAGLYLFTVNEVRDWGS
jgi:hypothetical protein